MPEGADPEQLDQLGNRFRSAAVRIDGHVGELQRLSTEALWHGADAEEFVTLIRGDLRMRLNHGTARLREAAEELHKQADEQRDASSAYGTSGRNGPNPGVVDHSGELWQTAWTILFGLFGWVGGRGLPDPAPLWSGDLPSGRRDFSGVSLYGPDGQPSIDEVDQGKAGDCYFAAALAALAMTPHGRQTITDMITDNHDGTYTVHFPDGDERVDGELWVDKNGNPEYGKANGASWFAIIEKAYAQHEGSYHNIESGYAGSTAAWLTGGTASAIGMGSGAEAFANVQNQISAGHPTFASTASLPGGGSTWEASSGAVIHGDHAYTVVGAEMRGGEQMIHLRNPWGAAGLSNEGEDVWISAGDFAKAFNRLETVS